MGAGQEEVRHAIELVERAKAALVSAAPTGRAAGAPLAEALAGFEAHLRDARDVIGRIASGWDDVDGPACVAAIDASLAVAEWLRLEGDPGAGYERLYPILADAMRPLEVFDQVLRRHGG